ncbi:putative holin-like toxin, partial [Leuconostoc pseudomesenteroides]
MSVADALQLMLAFG